MVITDAVSRALGPRLDSGWCNCCIVSGDNEAGAVVVEAFEDGDGETVVMDVRATDGTVKVEFDRNLGDVSSIEVLSAFVRVSPSTGASII
jgi:hypothetical protein